MSIDHRYMNDSTQPLDERVTYLLEQMTLDEKLGQIAGVWVTALIDTQRQFDETKAAAALSQGVGHITRIGAASFLKPQDSARLANRIQKHLVEDTRLGIPAIVHEESCAGYMARGATSFPQALGLAATWNPELLGEMVEVIRQQMRAVGAHHALAPVLDVVRDARWGRVEETFGEDPFLISSLGTAYIRALQTENLREGIVATAKHFFAHGLPEGGRNWAPVFMGQRELREIFLTPFKAVLEHADVATVMNAYHEMDGIPLGASREYMVDLLRGELGFEGVVVSDYFTLRKLFDYHFVAQDEGDAARLGLEAGIDIELPFADCYGKPLKEAIEAGKVEIGLVEESVRRVLRMKLDLGLFDSPYVDEGKVLEVYGQPEQVALSRRMAAESYVLLKNDGLLPLDRSIKSIALIGPHADDARLMQGDYHYPGHLDHIYEQERMDAAPNPEEVAARIHWPDHMPPSVTVLQGVQAAVSADTQVTYVRGCDVNSEDRSSFAEAVAAAEAAEVVILTLGDKSGLGNSCTVGESLDSATLDLPGVQQELIEAIHATGTPIVLLLMTGRPYVLTWADDNLAAIIEAWLPAEQGGAAAADILFGDVNPAGRLPMTFPRSVGQVPIYYNHKPSGARSNWKVNYTDETVAPLYAFGHGLSYTDFNYRDLVLSSSNVEVGGSLSVTVTVENSGERAGDEVVQLYVSDPIASLTRPVKMLKGFKRIHLQAGEARTLRFDLDTRHLAFYDQAMNYIVEAGEIQVMVGSSSADIRLCESFQMTGDCKAVDQVYFTPVDLN